MENTKFQFNTFLNECIIATNEPAGHLISSEKVSENCINEKALCTMDNKSYTTILQHLRERREVNERFICCVTSVRRRGRHRVVSKNSYHRVNDRIREMQEEIKSKREEKTRLAVEKRALILEIRKYEDIPIDWEKVSTEIC